MIIYYSIFLYIIIFCFREKLNKYNSINFHHRIFLLFLLIFIGFRYEVGVDWASYLIIYEQIGNYSLTELINLQYSILYFFITWVGFNFSLNIWFVNLICSFLFLIGIFYAMKSTPYPWLFLGMSFPYTILAFSMNYTRQSAAFGLVLIALYFLFNKKIFKSIIFIILSSQFHISTLIFVPVCLLSFVNFNIKKYLFLSFFCFFIFYFLYLKGYFYGLLHMYFYWRSEWNPDHPIESRGAPLRLILNAISGLLFLYSYKIFKFNTIFFKYMFISSFISIILFLLMLIYGPLTILDRFGLYFIPLQFYLFTYLLYFYTNSMQKYYLRIFVFLFFSFYFIIWINFSNHHEHWIPYSTYLFN